MYITRTDLEAVIPAEEFAELLDRDQDGEEDTDAGTWITAALNAAVSQMHTLLARRYALPLNSADTLLMDFVRPGLCDLAWVALHPRADMATDALKTRAKAFVTRLEEIRDGQADLPASNMPAATGPATGVLWSAAVRKTLGGMP